MAGAGAAAALFVAATVGSALLTWAWIVIAHRRALHDLPGRRRLHDSATPRGGGIAIALAMLGTLAWIGVAANPGHAAWVPGLAAGIAAFAAVGMLDDLLPVPALAKLALQLAAAGVLLAGAAGAFPGPWFVGIGLLLACAYFVNIWNFMDGSNGLVTIQALLLSLALAAWPSQDWTLRLAALALAGACLGFMPFNFPGARVFLGDVGSHAMGAAVFGLLWLSWRAGTISAAQALLMVTVIVLDTGLTLLRRLLAGRAIWQAHREHLFQYAVRRGNSHARVAIAYGAATVLAITLAWLGGRSRSDFVMPGLLILAFAIGALVYVVLRRFWLDLRLKKGIEE